MSNQNKTMWLQFSDSVQHGTTSAARRVPYTKQCVCGRVFALDPARGAYSVPLVLCDIAGGDRFAANRKKGKQKKREGMDMRRNKTKEREGRNTNYTIEINFWLGPQMVDSQRQLRLTLGMWRTKINAHEDIQNNTIRLLVGATSTTV